MGFFSSLFGGDTSEYEQVYREADEAGANEVCYEIENRMYDKGLVYDAKSESWEPQDHEEPSSGGFWSRLFG